MSVGAMQMWLRRILSGATLVLALATAGCGGGSDGPVEPGNGPAPGPGDVVQVRLDSNELRFDPAQATIGVGTTIRWVHGAGSLLHTVTPDGHDEWPRQVLDASGEQFEHTFDQTGEFPYFCEPHRLNGMVGAITVQ